MNARSPARVPDANLAWRHHSKGSLQFGAVGVEHGQRDPALLGRGQPSQAKEQDTRSNSPLAKDELPEILVERDQQGVL